MVPKAILAGSCSVLTVMLGFASTTALSRQEPEKSAQGVVITPEEHCKIVSGPTEEQLRLLEKVKAFARDVAGNDEAKYAQIVDKAFLIAEDPERMSVLPMAPSAASVRPSSRKMNTRSFHKTQRKSIYDDPVYIKNSKFLPPSGLRILGGHDTGPTDFPDCVAVGSENDWCCTGTLVAPNVVVTAGHCAEECATRIYVGINTNNPDPTKIFKVGKVIRHQDYAELGDLVKNDLTVLILEKDVPGVAPRKIAQAEMIDQAALLLIVGFGTTDKLGTIGYGKQRKVSVAIASPSCDASAAVDRYGCISGLEIVAGTPNRDSCSGDSGGPAYVKSGEQWFLAGATSRGVRVSDAPCGNGGIYVRLDKYVDFIKSVALANNGHWKD